MHISLFSNPCLCVTSNIRIETNKLYPHEHKGLFHAVEIFHEEGIHYSLSTDDLFLFILV
jgi:hypothetical protein